ncbi:MAG: hypothetical protein ACYC6A_12095 [Armatimonadota bacterium]
MQTLSSYFSLEHSLRLYVPGTVNVNEDAASQQETMVLRVLDNFSEWFGGATSYKAEGAWKSPAAGLVIEKVTIVESYASTEAVEANLGNVLNLCEEIKAEMKQEAVALEYDNRLFLI